MAADAQALLKVHVLPRGSKNEVTGRREDALCIKLTAPPVENAANKALIEFIADLLGIKKGQVEIVSGHKSREKTLRISGIGQEEVDGLLPPAKQGNP